MPQNERFMDAQSEAGIEKACKSVPATEAWWNLFRLLMPGMQGRDLGSLIQQFGPKYPCKTVVPPASSEGAIELSVCQLTQT